MKPPFRWLPWAAVAALLAVLLCSTTGTAGISGTISTSAGVGSFPNSTPQPSKRTTSSFTSGDMLTSTGSFSSACGRRTGVGGIAAVTLLFAAFWAAAFGAWLKTTQLRRSGAWGAAAALVASVVVTMTRAMSAPEILSYVFPRAPNPLAGQLGPVRASGKMGLRPLCPGRSPLGQRPRLLRLRPPPRRPAHRLRDGLSIRSLPRSSRPSCKNPSSSFSLSPSSPAWPRPLASTVGSRSSPSAACSTNCASPSRNFCRPGRFPLGSGRSPSFGVRGLAALAGAGWLAATAWRRELFALLLAALGLYLGATAYRNIPLFIFLCAPLIAALRARLVPGGDGPRRAAIGVTLAAGALAAWAVAGGFYRSLGLPSAFGIGESATAYPSAFAAYFRTREFSGSVFNSMADGGYLEFHFPSLQLPLQRSPHHPNPAAEDPVFRRPAPAPGLLRHPGRVRVRRRPAFRDREPPGGDRARLSPARAQLDPGPRRPAPGLLCPAASARPAPRTFPATSISITARISRAAPSRVSRDPVGCRFSPRPAIAATPFSPP